jgi:hypothetical protein
MRIREKMQHEWFVEVAVPKVRVNDITMNYEQQGTGASRLSLIPYLAADNACYAFQVADYAKQFTCISIDPRGAGEKWNFLKSCVEDERREEALQLPELQAEKTI